MEFKADNYKDVENNILIENLKVDKLNKEIINMIRQGFNYLEITKHLNISRMCYYNRLKKIRKNKDIGYIYGR